MDALSKAIVEAVETKISDIAQKTNWQQFKEKLAATALEPAMETGLLNGCEDVNREIISTAWHQVCGPDNLTLALTISDPDTLALTVLFRRLFQSDYPTVTVVTTNYDRLVEYAAGAGPYLYRTGFNPGYAGRWRSSQGTLKYTSGNVPTRNIERTVEIWKVHGSLDWFRDPKSGAIVSIPVGTEPPHDLIPLIVPPGLTKYQETHQDPFRTILAGADGALIKGNGFLSIGYGFNDEHIHVKLIERVKKEKKPIVVLTKLLTDKTREFLFGGSSVQFVAMEEIEHFGTRIYTSDEPKGIEIEGINYWDFRHFVREAI